MPQISIFFSLVNPQQLWLFFFCFFSVKGRLNIFSYLFKLFSPQFLSFTRIVLGESIRKNLQDSRILMFFFRKMYLKMTQAVYHPLKKVFKNKPQARVRMTTSRIYVWHMSYLIFLCKLIGISFFFLPSIFIHLIHSLVRLIELREWISLIQQNFKDLIWVFWLLFHIP